MRARPKQPATSCWYSCARPSSEFAKHTYVAPLTQYTAVVQDAGLDAVVAKTSATQEDVGKALHAFLESPELLIAPQRLHSLPTPLPATIHRAALAQIAHQYAEAHPAPASPAATSGLPGPSEVAMLLDVQNMEQSMPARALLERALAATTSTKST